MNTFDIIITEKLQKRIKVTAKTAEEALEWAHQCYWAGDEDAYILDAHDHVSTSIMLADNEAEEDDAYGLTD